MRNGILIFLLLLPLSVLADQLIPPQMGEPCAEFVSIEQALGASIAEQSENSYLLESRYFGQPAQIKLACHQDKLVRVVYTFLFDEFSQAKQLFRAQQGDLMMRYGPPNLDQSSEDYIAKMRDIGFEVKEEHKQMLLWQTNQQNVTFGASRGVNGESFVTLDIIPGESSPIQHSHHHP